MAKTNIIPMQAESEQISLEKAVSSVVALLVDRGTKALNRIREAEQTALERLESYVPTEPLLDIKQAAAYLGFTKRWLDEGTRPGREPVIPFILIGGEKRFRKSSIDNALTSREVRPKKVSL